MFSDGRLGVLEDDFIDAIGVAVKQVREAQAMRIAELEAEVQRLRGMIRKQDMGELEWG
jgi:hypothetical protein